MTEDEALGRLLRLALPPVADRPASRDLWPAVVDRRPAPASRPWLDLGIAAAAALLVSLLPGSLWLLLYHL